MCDFNIQKLQLWSASALSANWVEDSASSEVRISFAMHVYISAYNNNAKLKDWFGRKEEAAVGNASMASIHSKNQVQLESNQSQRAVAQTSQQHSFSSWTRM